jgi:hypothetical protein
VRAPREELASARAARFVGFYGHLRPRRAADETMYVAPAGGRARPTT